MLTGAGARAQSRDERIRIDQKHFRTQPDLWPRYTGLEREKKDEESESCTAILLQFLGFVMEELLGGHMNEYKADGNGCDL